MKEYYTVYCTVYNIYYIIYQEEKPHIGKSPKGKNPRGNKKQ